MRKFNFSKGVSTALVAMALVTGLSVPVDAAKVDKALSQSEVTKSGATVTTAAPAIALKESTGKGKVETDWTFTYSPVPAPYVYKDAEGNESKRDYTMYVLVFDEGDRTKPVYGSTSVDAMGKLVYSSWTSMSYVDPAQNPGTKYEFTLSASQLTPGKKEVVAYLFDNAGYQADLAAAEVAADKNYDAACEAWRNAGAVGYGPVWSDYHNTKALGVSEADYMIASAPVAITVDSQASVETAVTSTSIQLDMNAVGATGYEISRKVGKKYQVIATVAANVYTDKGLESKKTYSYKVRPYYVNKTTNKTVYGETTVAEATTKGSALNLQIKVKGKKNVLLSWKKVADATSYEIYRTDTSSYDTKQAKGLYNGYNTYKKIATVKKSKKKYVDKKVSANQSYGYIVRAVIPKSNKVKGDKEFTVDEGKSIDLSFGKIVVTKEPYKDANGNKTVEWEKVYGATSYIVEKYTYDYTTKKGDWGVYTTLGKNTTKVKLPAGTVTEPDGTVHNDTEYRIKAANGTKYSEPYEVTTYYSLGNLQKVTAKAVANGIQVSWTAVPGAAYYKVYRVPTDRLLDNKDTGAYAVQQGTRVTEYVGATTATPVDVTAYNAAVDASIAQMNADYEAYKKSTDPNASFDSSKYLSASDKLDVNRTYYYQNYSYARSTFDASVTSIVDYVGDIYSGSRESYTVKTATVGADGKATPTAYEAGYNPIVAAEKVKNTAKDGIAQAGVDYTYYVQAVQATAKTADDYKGKYTTEDGKVYYNRTSSWFDQAAYAAARKAANDAYEKAYAEYQKALDDYNNGVITERPERPTRTYVESTDYYHEYVDGYYTYMNTYVPTYNMAVTGAFADTKAYTGAAAYVIDEVDFKNEVGSTSGVTKVGSATFTSTVAVKKALKIKSLSSSKGKVTLKLKKKVKAADYYKVYRSTKKKGKYTVAGITKNAKKLSFTDAGVTKGKTYYYKVVPVVKNEAGAEVEGKASKVKSIKVK